MKTKSKIYYRKENLKNKNLEKYFKNINSKMYYKNSNTKIISKFKFGIHFVLYSYFYFKTKKNNFVISHNA